MMNRLFIFLMLMASATTLAQDATRSTIERKISATTHRLSADSAPVAYGDSLHVQYELVNTDAKGALFVWDPAAMLVHPDTALSYTIDAMGDWRYNPGFVQPLFLKKVEPGASCNCELRLPVARRAGSDTACTVALDGRLPGEMRYLYLSLSFYRDDGLFSGVSLEDLRKNGFPSQGENERFENGLQSVLLGPVVFFVKQK